MSLTSFLKNQDVKRRFSQEFAMPHIVLEGELKAPPLSKRYSLVGTAFDYLLRFYIEWLNPGAITAPWVAEMVFSLMIRQAIFGDETEALCKFYEQEAEAREYLEQAKVAYKEFLSSGRITDELLQGVIRLAKLDTIVRSMFVDENLGEVYQEDMDDLRKLIAIVDPELFKASYSCWLNPTFGEGSALVGGADADLLIDNALIDIKTTKYLKFQRDYFNQLIGYYVLHRIGRVNEPTLQPEVSRVGIYFSRHGILHMLDLRNIVHEETFSDFVNWFIARAKQEREKRIGYSP